MIRKGDDTAILIGYAKLAEAVIYSAVRPESRFKSTLLKTKHINSRFARHSKLIQHFADVFHLDEARIIKAILKANE